MPWMLTETAGEQPAYLTEASDIGWPVGGGGQATCPDCEAVLYFRYFRAHRVEGAITHWSATCGCGALFTVLND